MRRDRQPPLCGNKPEDLFRRQTERIEQESRFKGEDIAVLVDHRLIAEDKGVIVHFRKASRNFFGPGGGGRPRAAMADTSAALRAASASAAAMLLALGRPVKPGEKPMPAGLSLYWPRACR